MLEVAPMAFLTKFLPWFPIIISLCWSLPRTMKESCVTYLYVHIVLPETQ